MRRFARSFVCLMPLLASVALAAPSSSQTPQSKEPDRLVGVWQLDLAKSKYSPGPAPKSETRTYTRDQEGLKGLVVRRWADGREERIEYRADFDREYPVSGTEAFDAVTFKRVDSRTADAVLSHAGKVFGTARRVISEDGQTMTITFRQESATVVNNVAIYRKEQTN